MSDADNSDVAATVLSLNPSQLDVVKRVLQNIHGENTLAKRKKVVVDDSGESESEAAHQPRRSSPAARSLVLQQFTGSRMLARVGNLSNSERRFVPAAAHLGLAFLETYSEVTGRCMLMQVNHLPSHGRLQYLTHHDWMEWQQQLTRHCDYDSRTQEIRSATGSWVVANLASWEAVCVWELRSVRDALSANATMSETKIPFRIVAAVAPFSTAEVAMDSVDPTNSRGDPGESSGYSRPSVYRPPHDTGSNDRQEGSGSNSDPDQSLHRRTCCGECTGSSDGQGSATIVDQLGDKSSSEDGGQIADESNHETSFATFTAPTDEPSEDTGDRPAGWHNSDNDYEDENEDEDAELSPAPPKFRRRHTTIETTNRLDEPDRNQTTSIHLINLSTPSLASKDASRDPEENDTELDVLQPVNSNNGDGNNAGDLDDDVSVTDPAELIRPNKFRCEQMNPEMWRDFCSFFMLPRDGVDGTHPDRAIPFWGMRRNPRPYQLYAVFWAIMREAGNEGGGFIGDEMGIGKTMETITYFVVTSWLITNFRHVQRSRRYSKLAERHH